MAAERREVETPGRDPQFSLLIPDKTTVISGLSHTRYGKEQTIPYGFVPNRIRATKELTLP